MNDQTLKAGTRGRKRKRVFRRILGTLFVLLLIGAGGLYAYARLKDEYTVTYDEYTATTGTISNSLSFSGTLALRKSESHTAAGTATVRNVYVENGDTVKEGQKLVRLSTGTTLTAGIDGTVNVVNVAAGDEVTAFTVYFAEGAGSSEVSAELETALDEMFSFEEDCYTITTMDAIESTMETMTGMMTTLLAGIASIALIVGGIGIMNMMLTTVTRAPSIPCMFPSRRTRIRDTA